MPAASREEKAAAAAAAGDVCVWLIVGLFFLVLLAGGTFLALYIALPAHAAPAWYPLVGISLVGVPWTFWLLMCVYRCVAVRAADVERPPPTMRPAAVAPVAGAPAAGGGAAEGAGSPAGSPGGARRVRFGNATVMGAAAPEDSRGNGGRGDPQAESESGEDGSSSLKSHESEVPLALSMS